MQRTNADLIKERAEAIKCRDEAMKLLKNEKELLRATKQRWIRIGVMTFGAIVAVALMVISA